MMSLKARLAIRAGMVVPLLGALLFAPAGSFRFWRGWVYLGIFVAFTVAFTGHFYRRDPELVQRRMKMKETRPRQKILMMIWQPLWLVGLALPGVDYRLGWSAAAAGGVPLWLTGVSLVLLAAGWVIVFQVMRFNTFASSVVQVEEGQKVITDGPYRVVRHPMYTGFILMIVATPLALGSYVAMVPSLLLIFVMVLRLFDEERFLRKELPGYAEYCELTRYRLIPRLF